MIKFSEINQAFYDISLEYIILPDDLIEITSNEHQELLDAINRGCHVSSDLTYSEPKPSQFHEWNGKTWVDNRTEQEIAEYKRSLLPVLSKRQFALYLYDHESYDTVMTALDQNPRFKIEYETSKELERLSPTVSAMAALLGWTEDQVDQMWTEALTL